MDLGRIEECGVGLIGTDLGCVRTSRVGNGRTGPRVWSVRNCDFEVLYNEENMRVGIGIGIYLK